MYSVISSSHGQTNGHTRTQTCSSCSTASAPAAISADKLGWLIASQKLLATLGISGPVGACWGGLSHTEPPHAVTALLMRCGIFHGASRLPGWRQIIGTSASAAFGRALVTRAHTETDCVNTGEDTYDPFMLLFHNINSINIPNCSTIGSGICPWGEQCSNATVMWQLPQGSLMLQSPLFTHILHWQQFKTFV